MRPPGKTLHCVRPTRASRVPRPQIPIPISYIHTPPIRSSFPDYSHQRHLAGTPQRNKHRGNRPNLFPTGADDRGQWLS
ncbi:hypothetical protein BRADI_2g49182v3 [Brachypodium distachyon]|uniref:Uncharacterized protein n=1 Tax=Brachypodium distachyon TaxID=15368 RepID=A0A2K2DES6_BRADI|nr:hypothetical protein BRADI_2g49182v3 [Brachypodium distachyon]